MASANTVCFNMGMGAFIAAEDGRFIHPLWWPFYPLFSIIRILQIAIVFALILILLPLAVIGMLIELPSKMRQTTWAPQRISRIVSTLGVLVIGFAGLYLLLIALSLCSALLKKQGVPDVIALSPYLLLLVLT